MIQLYRARLVLVAAILIAAVVLATQLHLGEVFHQRAQLSAAASELAAVDANNRRLQADVTALRQRSTIATIAHNEYGLVHPGQRAYVVLPARTGGAREGASSLLASDRLPATDLVAGDAAALAGSGIGASTPSAPKPSGSVWSRTLTRLEFWRGTF